MMICTVIDLTRVRKVIPSNAGACLSISSNNQQIPVAFPQYGAGTGRQSIEARRFAQCAQLPLSSLISAHEWQASDVQGGNTPSAGGCTHRKHELPLLHHRMPRFLSA